MANIKIAGQVNKTYRTIASVFAFGICLIFKGKKKKPMSKHLKRYKRVSKHSLSLLETVSNKITASNVSENALDYAKCLEIYKASTQKGQENEN
ncbi:MAG: hypothetical protein LUC25_07915 [Ruminococcus sp.]|nr:hypothetical protein [Ruminococcus sp.]